MWQHSLDGASVEKHRLHVLQISSAEFSHEGEASALLDFEYETRSVVKVILTTALVRGVSRSAIRKNKRQPSRLYSNGRFVA